MKVFIKKQLKKFPGVYSFLRYKILETRYKSPKKLRMKNRLKKIKALSKNLDLEPQYKKEKLPKGSLIEITNTCNLDCVMCNTKMSKRPVGFMEPQNFEMILRQLKGIGINTVGLHTVGEPFMYKNLEELFEIAERYGFGIWLSTNGQFPQRIEQLYRRFPNSANSYRLSIDGATPKIFEFIRRGASFDKLIESLETIHKINHEKPNYRIYLSIDSVLSMSNMFEAPIFFKAFVKYCWPENIYFHIINGLSPDTTYFWKEFPFSGLIRYNVPCCMPFRNIYFTYGGKATLCCRDYEEELVIGDIGEKSILELWNSPEAESIREKHLNPDKMDIKACSKCYAPYEFASNVLNEYIHFLIDAYPQLSQQQFGKQLVSLLSNMNSAKQKGDINSLKQCILNAFQ